MTDLTCREVRALAESYLHQDVFEVHGSVEGAVHQFVDDDHGSGDDLRSELRTVDAEYAEPAAAERFWCQEIELEVFPPGLGVSYEDSPRGSSRERRRSATGEEGASVRVWRRRSRRSAPAPERETKDAYPATLQLHLAYFHKDWGEEYRTAENAVAMFIQRSDLAPLLAEETRRILDTYESEEDLDSFFERRMGDAVNESFPATHEFHAGHLHQEWVEDSGTKA